jgi:tRNA (guanine37-N1)-methyltransferase
VLRVDVVTLFPELFDLPLRTSVIGRAIERGLLQVGTHDLREHGLGRHRSVDDYPYGGGAGMVLRPEPLAAAIQPLREAGAHVVLLDPAGERLTDGLARELATLPHLALVCGRYEGIDERARSLADREVSIGDYVLTGGELPALVLIDAVARLVPGVIEAASTDSDSFAAGLLEYPQYTRPEAFDGRDVPPILLSGNHGEVDRWRRREALRRTLLRRPDLLDSAPLSDADRAVLDELREHPMSVRLGDPADVESAASVFQRSNLARRRGRPMSAGRIESVTDLLRDADSWFFLAEDEGDAVGMTCAAPLRADDGAGAVLPGMLFLGYVFVVPERWGQGIGGIILDATLEEARRRGYHRIELWTHEDDNQRAQHLYRSRGFSPTGRTLADDHGVRSGQWAREINLPEG